MPGLGELCASTATVLNAVPVNYRQTSRSLVISLALNFSVVFFFFKWQLN